ncbi:MAG TPA: DNA-directed RNA polymerase subunit beta [Candidatus Dojkabacteria bacterium]|nr:DNA-directed RNA polymerase subunit beta [Candidatus Dojkabacteria bacterium]HQF36829.1 DNA-directed RNA polymerase subunit beta [Candidatus Dojkabacteria bacterium]
MSKLPFVHGQYVTDNPIKRVHLEAIKRITTPPDLIQGQLSSFEWFTKNGIHELFSLVNPITDPTGKQWEVNFIDFRFGEPNRTEEEALLKDLTYDAPFYSTIRLTNKKNGITKEEEVFLMDFPIMTKSGNFIHNGVTRVVVHQLIRAEGVTFDKTQSRNINDRPIYNAKLRPQRGTWIEFTVNRSGVIYVKFMRGNIKIPLTMLLKALGVGSNSDIIKQFEDVDTGEIKYIQTSLKADPTISMEDAALTIYQSLRGDETAGVQTATRYIRSLFFDVRRFYLGRVGRYQMCMKFDKKMIDNEKNFRLTTTDLIDITKRLIEINNEKVMPDDVDSLANRRVRSVGEILVSQLEAGIFKMEKNIKDKLSLHGEKAKISPQKVINAKALKASVNVFLGTNSLSRFLDQENVLSEVENKRRVTASGTGGVASDRATFSIRDIHFSQYGRMCPIKTPEKMNIGVVTHMSLYSKINEYGFIEVLYRKVKKSLIVGKDEVENRILKEKVGKLKEGHLITKADANYLVKEFKDKEINVQPFVSDELVWIDPHEEQSLTTSISTIAKDEYNNIIPGFVPARHEGEFKKVSHEEIDIVDVIPSQFGSISLSLIPFAQNTYDARLLFDTNMLCQAVPLIKPQSPIIGTGLEEFVAKQTGWAIYSPCDGVVSFIDSNKIIITEDKTKKEHELTIIKYRQSNQNTSFSQTPVVSVDQKVSKGELLADGPAIKDGELALGRNLLVAYMFMDGFNYEDGYVISEKLVKQDLLTSVHVQTHSIDIRDTKLGPEVITRDIPGIAEKSIRHLDDKGLIRIGAYVSGGDILVGVVAPKGEQELSAEEKLLRVIFGEPSKEIVDNSLRVPHGENGTVIKVHVLDSTKGDKLKPGVIKQVKVWIASTKKINLGDKLTDRYGQKGTVTRILPEEDMPHLEDGTPVDLVITPLAVKRMNLGQLLETYYSNTAYSKGVNVAIPSFEPINEKWFADVKREYDLSETNKVTLFDGRTGRKLDNDVAVGYRYILRLKHIASEKMHARSTGPYTMVTQQPLAGKSRRGGQRFGEMEVWVLEAYGAAHTLQEMLTIKSDDVEGRSSAYKSILNGDPIEVMKVPASFNVLIRELNSLGIKVDLFNVRK